MALITKNLAGLSYLLTLRYNPLQKAIKPRLTPEDMLPLYHDRIEQHILAIVKQTMPEIKEATITLSGGIDSHFTLAMLRRFSSETRLQGICIGFGDENDETKQAQELARKYNINCQSIIVENPLADLEEIVTEIVKEPRWNIYAYYIFKNAKTKTVFTGDGGDELWAGYTFRYANYLRESPTTVEDRVCAYMDGHIRDWVDNQRELFGPAIDYSIMDEMEYLKPYFDSGLSWLDQILLADYNGKLLYDYLPTAHAFAQHFDLDIKSLFLTSEMTYLAMHTDYWLKYDGERGKIPLQNILGIKETKKRGFGMDLVRLWKEHGHQLYKEWIHQDSAIVKDGIISRDWIAKQHPNEPRYINKRLQLIALEMWYRKQQ